MEDDERKPNQRETAADEGADAGDRIVAALDHLRSVLSRDGQASWEEEYGPQEACLRAWAESQHLLLTPDDCPEFRRGGQEHDVSFDDSSERIFKLTRHGVFGFTPGINIEVVSDEEDPRRFNLWDATPYRYLERLLLQNELTPGLNRLEGIVGYGNELAIMISQPRFPLNPVSQPEIDQWFASLGFEWIANAAYYRAEDNLAVFDAHDKNVIRVGEDLVPFDIIPVRPSGGFQEFIEDTIKAGVGLTAKRTTRTTDR